ncbi:MAG TPA: glycosyltransferase family 2 protein [Gemmataceae bacterium]|nr:glycosyltransferase family 2 protein [Gemmataceae bacterium]
MPELSILIPTFNDETVLRGTVGKLHDTVTHSSLNVETLIVDDESTDGTLNVAQQLMADYPALHIRVFARKRRHRGFGGLVRFGMAYATSPYCVIVSSDGHDPVELLPTFLAKLRSGCHLVQCSRYSRKEDAESVPFFYRVYQAIYRRAIRLLLGMKIKDSTYGFRAFNRNYVHALGVSANRFNICPEMTFKILLSGGMVEYIPGKQGSLKRGGSQKFRLPFEIFGYANVLRQAWFYRLGVPWF